ncbi:hypothetical protein F511_25492 [Dorcoceras hygrometricum]|uniref:Uncharacterized protein n=1 Tax=Dorcoceras hygrometricum TaxID=472368 RepID=A0A2Z7D819_9LAMI|nr:hypothetical protein F511_25492 [Dorcoceras hygrometricum]
MVHSKGKVMEIALQENKGRDNHVILAYEVFDGVGESFAIRREDGDVSLPRMCHWVTKKWSKSHSPSLNDVTNALSSFRWEDMSGMLTPTAAELLSVHYLPVDFTVSNKSAVTRRISELMSRGLKVVCSQHSFTDEQMDDVAEDSHSPSTSLTHIIRLPRSPPRRIPVPHSPPPHSPPRSSPPRSPPPRNPPPPSPSHMHRLEVRLTRVEETLTVIRKEHSGIMDILRHFQSDILSLKKIIEDEIAQSLVNTVGDLALAKLPPVPEVT